jgi:hypothetical protein
MSCLPPSIMRFSLKKYDGWNEGKPVGPSRLAHGIEGNSMSTVLSFLAGILSARFIFSR